MNETKFEKLIYIFLFTLSIVFISGFSIMSIGNSIKIGNVFYFIPFVILIGLLLVFSKYICDNTNIKIKILIIFFIAFILRSLIAISFDSIPFNDFATYLNSAKSLAHNNIAPVSSDLYYNRYPELFGFIIWESILIKIFGYNLLALKLVNCFISSLTCVLIYIIGKSYNDKIGFVAACLYAIYPSQIIMTSVFSNQHFATFLYLLCISLIQYKVINKYNIKYKAMWCILIGVILALGNIIRPIAPPILLAIIFYFLINIGNAILLKNKKHIKINLITILIPICFIITGKLYYIGINNYGLTDELFPSSDLKYKFVIGLNFDRNGQYSDPLASEFWNGDDITRKNLFDESIQNVISNPISTFNLITKKMNVLFGNSDSSFYWLTGQNKLESSSNSLLFDKCEKLYMSIDTVFLSIIYTFAVFGLFFIYKFEDITFSKLLVWIFLGYVGAHCLIEIQSRYRYFLMPIIIIFSSYAMNYFFSYVKNKNINSY